MIPDRPVRLWPGVGAAVLLWVFWIGVPLVMADGILYAMGGAAACVLAIVVWWLFFSRARWLDRFAAIGMLIVAPFIVRLVIHPSIENAGMGNLFYIYSVPLLGTALVVWAVATRRASATMRRATMPIALLAGCGLMALVRTGGITGGGTSDMHWRWTPTPEEKLLAAEPAAPAPPVAAAPVAPPAAAPVAPPAAAAPAATAPTASPATSKPGGLAMSDTEGHASSTPSGAVEWPGFRGPSRDGVARGVRIKTDWAAAPPVEMWRRPIGPGWSSFAVHGDLLYTQEQRGEEELVSCYRVSTGKPVWQHRDHVRFWESNGGAGPRATPTLSDGRVYALGATGILNALDANTGRALWSRDAAKDTAVEIPGWGFAGSPLVIDNLVIVALSGRLAAYDAASGESRWLGPTGGGGYSSPHLVSIDGVAQVVLLRGSKTISVAPDTGEVLWDHVWIPSASIVQPAMIAPGEILIATSDAMGGLGVRRLDIAHSDGGWTVQDKWTSRGLKPYFNDFVVHKGHAYGFDGNILSCIDLNDGSRSWKGGRYGNGQMVLLPDQDVLLVTTEEGEIALVSATADKFTELARIPALNSKTWNHPVIAGNVLLVRNGDEMVAFRLSLAGN